MVWLTRRSSPARIAGSASTSVTRQPRGAIIEANSHPMMPPPTMIMLSGSSSISRAVVEVRTAGCSGSMPARRAGSEPVAITIVGADSSCTPSPVSTATRSGAVSQPSPRTTVTPRCAHAPSTPPRIFAAMPMARSRIAGQSTPTSPSAMPQSAASRSRATSSDEASSALVGMQPRLTQVPPSRSRSTRMTLAPSWAARSAATSPAGPPPSTRTRASGKRYAGVGGAGLADDRRPRGERLVEPPHRGGVGRPPGDLGVLGRLAQDLRDDLGERLERLARLGLGGLHQQRLLHQQREVDRRRVVAEVEQALGEVGRADAQVALHRGAREHELVHAALAERERQVLADARPLQQGQQVVRVQHRDLRRLAQPLGAERADVGVGADEDPVVALEPAQPADRLRPVLVEVVGGPVAVRALAAHDARHHQVGLDAVAHGDRPGARPAAAVRLGERLVQVEVHDVEAHVARAADAHDRVQVGAVVVEGRAGVVDDARDLLDVRVEEAERVGVGEHEAGDPVVGLAPQVLEVDPAVGRGADLHDLVAGHRHRGRVGAVGGVGRQHERALVAAVGVVGAAQQHPGQLAVRAGAGLQRHVRQAADLRQGALQVPHQLERPLGAARRLEGVQARVAGQGGDPLVQLRVVLHRARAQRVEAGVEVEVALAEPVVVAHDLGLGHLGQLGRRLAAQARGQQLVERPLGDVERGRRRTRAGRGASARRSSSRSRAAGASARRRSRDRPRPVAGRPLGGHGAAEDVGQAVDVGAAAALGDRHQQPVLVLRQEPPERAGRG